MTKLTFNFANEFTANVRKNEMAVAVAQFEGNEAAISKVFAYGLQRILNDATGAIKRDAFEDEAEYNEAVLEAAQDKLEAILTGKTRERKAGLSTLDAMVRKVAWEHVRVVLKQKGVAAKTLTDEKREGAIDRMIEMKGEEIRAEAEKRIADEKAASESVDLADLGL